MRVARDSYPRAPWNRVESCDGATERMTAYREALFAPARILEKVRKKLGRGKQAIINGTVPLTHTTQVM